MTGFEFGVTDVLEHMAPDDGVVASLGDLVLRAKTDPALLDRMAGAIGWGDALARVRASARPQMRRGDFGEVLTSNVLEEFDDYTVPVKKLRFQTDPEQAMHGTDVVGFRFEDDELVELHFVESKLRTFRDLARCVEAHEQLMSNRSEGYADTLMFLGERLWETNRPLYERFEDYLAARGREDRGTYGIVLVWERSEWDEDVLDRLGEVELLVDPLQVHVLQIDGLRGLVERAFASIAHEVIDDGT